jgi:hypothetical protein
VTVKTDKSALYGKVKEILSPLLGSDPDNVMTEGGRGVIKTWSCWVAEAKGVNLPRISQLECICRAVSSLTGEKLTKDVAVHISLISNGPGRLLSAPLIPVTPECFAGVVFVWGV